MSAKRTHKKKRATRLSRFDALVLILDQSQIFYWLIVVSVVSLFCVTPLAALKEWVFSHQ
jgi:putative exporter of polyketide antibiotics